MDKTSLGFQKPKEEEYYDINIFNQNAQLSNDLIEKNSSAIGQIANDRGYVKIKSLGSLDDLNNIFGSGKYFSNLCLNRPISTDAFLIDVTGDGNSVVVQKATCYYGAGNVNFGKIYERIFYQASGGWTSWREIPTVNNISNPKLLINGDFQIWQRGTSFTSFVNSILTYTADRWYATQAIGTTISVSKDSDNSLKFSQTGVGGSHVAQFIEGDYSNLVGKKVTMSICSKGNVDTVMQMLDYNTGLGGKVVPASTEYIITTLTVTLPNSLTKDRLRCLLNFANNQGTINIKWIKLELGEIATPLSPRPVGEELALCKRYYQIVNTTVLGSTGRVYRRLTATDFVQMRIHPTVQKVISPSTLALNCIHEFGNSDYILGSNSKFNVTLNGPEFCEIYAGHNGANMDNINYGCYIHVDAEIY